MDETITPKLLRALTKRVSLWALVIGQKFGNYVATGLLGEGGMGSVYLAEHPSIGRRVAIKVLRPELNRDAELLGRFLNEARAANAIRHPNIIEILDSGTIEDGAPYLVLELLEGEPVSDRIKRLSRLSIPEAVEFAYQTASALGAAHKKRIVHRDLKPDNLFIVPDPSNPARERIKVLDFGIAKLSQQDAGDSVKTRTGTMMGTPVYMSPEQCLGTKEVDHHSDIYSLGVIIYEMLCGVPPFVSTGFGELVTMHLGATPKSPRALNPAIPEALEAVILKCLEKRAEDRYDTMHDLQEALKTAGGPSVTVRGTSSPNLGAGTIPTIKPNPAQHNTLAMGETMAGGNSTLSGVAAPTKRALPKRSGFVAAVIVSAGLAALVAVKVTGGGSANAPTLASVPAAALKPAMVVVKLSSQPLGADVTLLSEHRSLGRTPLTLEFPAAQTTIPLEFTLRGYQPVQRDLPLTGNLQEDIVLSAVIEPKSAVPLVKPTPPKRRPHPRAVDEPDEPAKL